MFALRGLLLGDRDRFAAENAPVAGQLVFGMGVAVFGEIGEVLGVFETLIKQHARILFGGRVGSDGGSRGGGGDDDGEKFHD